MRLILMRHAKSDWVSGVRDHDRSLNARGQRTAPQVGAALAAAGWTPDVVISSDSARARETWGLMADAFPHAEVRFDPRLYLADARTIFAVLAEIEGAATVLLLGHNPGMSTAVTLSCGADADLKTADAVLLETEATSWPEATEHRLRFRLVSLQSARALVP